MSAIRGFLLRLAGLFRRARGEARLRAELESHLHLLVEENLAKGLTPAEANAAARRALGNQVRIEEEWRSQRGLPWLEALMQDARYGLRMLRRNPGFAAVAIATLALGVGANTAIFSVVNAVVLRPLPYPHAAQLVSVVGPDAARGGTSYPNLESERAQNTVFSRMGGEITHQLTLTGRDEPSLVNTVVVDGEFFPVLQAQPLLGRTLLPDDARRGAAPAVVLSEKVWRERLGADPKILGSTVALDKRPFTVVGVMPASFRDPFFAATAQVWIPVQDDPIFGALMKFRAGGLLGVIARLKPGATIEQAQTEMNAITARLAREYPAADAKLTARVEPLLQAIVGGSVKTSLLLLLGAVGLVLLIACVNIVNLLLARATARGREMGVRLAIGAGRGRILRQLLTESALLGLLGGGAGVVLAYGGLQALVSILPADLPRVRAIAVDGPVLIFALGISLAAGILFGLAPAFVSAGARLQIGLREGAGRAGDGGRRRARNALAIAEIALAMVLLAGAGLLLHSFLALTSVNPGFNPSQVWTANVSLPQFEYSKPAQWSAFAEELMPRIQAQPGLSDAALAVPMPIYQQFVRLDFTIAGNPPLPRGATNAADWASVSPDYFRVMEIPLLAGRVFGPGDSMSAPPVTVISQALAKRYFGDENPLGRSMIFSFPTEKPAAREIVGVVGDIRDESLGHAPEPMMYVPFAQAPLWGGAVVVRTTLAPAAIAAAIRAQVRAIDRDLPVTDFQSVSFAVQETASAPRFRTLLVGLFGLIALALAAAGIFGVLSYSVSRRTNELGIRIALGATPGTIRRMVLREGAILAAAGLAIGIVAALFLTRLLQHQLYGVGANDPGTFAVTAILLAAVALAACYIPARRAMRVDPSRALRCE